MNRIKIIHGFCNPARLNIIFKKKSLMKSNALLIVVFALSVNALAQTATNVPSFPPPAPLSQATLDKISRMTPIFDGATLNGWEASKKGTNQPNATTVWSVKDGALASLGADRGVLYTTRSFGNYRIIFTMRHVSGNKDHQACVLIYCDPPRDGTALDALGGVQFQVPNGGHWDYRPDHNNGGKGEFTSPPHPKFDVHEWSQVEILVNTNGMARMAVAQPPGTKAYEVLDFNVPEAGKPGAFALQMHNKGLFDEYKDIRIEENPVEDKLITAE
jgi:hypothetical protein